jgi:ferritin-like metal-binding protein YciE
MRKLITNLLQPVVAQQTSDAEVVAAVNKHREKDEERIRALELIVFKDASVTTLMDDLRLRIEEGEAMVRKEVAEVADRAENW